jgi:small-conductance mechanosensitive channel
VEEPLSGLAAMGLSRQLPQEHFLLHLLRRLADPEFWLDLGQRLLVAAFVVLLAWVLLGLTKRVIHATVGRRLRDKRALTLATMFQSLVRYVVIVSVFLVCLYILGVPTAHLLAGMGIAGLALGFGAQNLVRDFVTGITLLLENSLAVGDRVVINNALEGEVIDMGLRVVRLRGRDGQVHHISYGVINSVSNFSHQAAGPVL